jgi:nucleotide-binding universal stress UspA family protein
VAVGTRIVVGVDGSAHGRAALRFAAEEARLRRAILVATHAWQFTAPVAVGTSDVMAMPAQNLSAELAADREVAERVLEEAIEDALGASPDVEIERLLVEDAPGEGLVVAAEGAELVVVGSRGRGSFASAVLGSVSHHVVQHAPCPVVIVRAEHDSEARAEPAST